MGESDKVLLVGPSPCGEMVLLAVDGAPVELPSSGRCDAIPVDALHPSVSLPEGVDVVDFLVVVGELLDELLAAEADEVVGLSQLTETVASC